MASGLSEGRTAGSASGAQASRSPLAEPEPEPELEAALRELCDSVRLYFERASQGHNDAREQLAETVERCEEML